MRVTELLVAVFESPWFVWDGASSTAAVASLGQRFLVTRVIGEGHPYLDGLPFIGVLQV